MNAQQTAQNLIHMAAEHADKNASATLCLQDAQELFQKGEYGYVKGRVLHSLRHSVGIFHADYKEASAA